MNNRFKVWTTFIMGFFLSFFVSALAPGRSFAASLEQVMREVNRSVERVQDARDTADRVYDSYTQARNDAVDAQTKFNMKNQAHNDGRANHSAAADAARRYNQAANESNQMRDRAVARREQFEERKRNELERLDQATQQLREAQLQAEETITRLDQEMTQVNQELARERAKPKWDAQAKRKIRELEKKLKQLENQKSQAQNQWEQMQMAQGRIDEVRNDLTNIDVDRNARGFADPLPNDHAPTCNCKPQEGEQKEQETSFVPLPLPINEPQTTVGHLLGGSRSMDHERDRESPEPGTSVEVSESSETAFREANPQLDPRISLTSEPQIAQTINQYGGNYELFHPVGLSSPTDPKLSTSPILSNSLGSFHEPTPQEIDFRKYGDTTGLDPQRGVTFVTNAKTGEITYFYPRYDDKFADSQVGTQAVTLLNGKVVRTDNYDHLGQLMAPAPSDSKPSENLTLTEVAKEYFKFGESRGGTDSSLGTAARVSSTYHINNSMSVGLDLEYMSGDDEGSEAAQTSVTPGLEGTTAPSDIPLPYQIRQTQGMINFYQDAIPKLETRLKNAEAKAERLNEIWEEARRKGNEAKMDEYGRKAAEAEVEAKNLKDELARYREDLARRQEELKTLQEQQSKSKSTKEKEAPLESRFAGFDVLQQGGFGTLNATPTATFDGAPQSRDMGSSVLTSELKPEAGGDKAEC